jgi:hypothetical protein
MGDDKFKHFVFGFFATLITLFISPRVLVPGVLLFACSAGIGIEIYQKVSGTGMFEWFDIGCWIVGVGIAALMFFIMKKEDE